MRRLVSILFATTGLMLFTVPAFATGGGGGHTPIVICHNNHTIAIDESAWPAHKAHGDKLGACPCAPQPTATATITATATSVVTETATLPAETVTATAPVVTATATETATEKATVKVTATKQVYIGGDSLAKTGFDYPLWVWYTLGAVLIAGSILLWVSHRYKGKHEA
ncbi:hypothetical protein U27_02605 [Candidatus Vecturithrix granuli]|uniref:Uncharacterized protein n=1 Tax=Vecturithrix granuli TaxID=1499967 RepID=A0A081CB18_VECG1|nr:hypothetical protein U27_02605 [Candidatus Vecturithrix granuli]